MAAAYESIATTNWADFAANPSNITVAKPTGLAAGDLMIFSIHGNFNAYADSGSVTPASGWTYIAGATQTSGNERSAVYAAGKIATAGDVAASNFTFACNIGGGTSAAAGTITRFSDAAYPTIFTSEFSSSALTTTLFANAITPTADCVLLMLLTTWSQTGSPTMSSYAIATSTPTWTEQFDNFTITGENGCAAVATGPRTATTSTGNWGATPSSSNGYSSGILIAIQSPVTGNAMFMGANF